MKKEKLVYIGLALIIAVMLFLDGGFTFSGEKISRVYNLTDLDLTQIDIQCEVYIARGNNEKLVLEAPDNVLKQLDITQNNGILSISKKTRSNHLFSFITKNLKPTGEVKIYINHSQLDRIIVNNEARIISVDYKQAQYHANSYQQEEEVAEYFPFALSNLKQQVIKNLFHRTIFTLPVKF